MKVVILGIFLVCFNLYSSNSYGNADTLRLLYTYNNKGGSKLARFQVGDMYWNNSPEGRKYFRGFLQSENGLAYTEFEKWRKNRLYAWGAYGVMVPFFLYSFADWNAVEGRKLFKRPFIYVSAGFFITAAVYGMKSDAALRRCVKVFNSKRTSR